MSTAVESLTDQELRAALVSYGQKVGPVGPTTRSVYEKKLRAILENEQLHEVKATPQKASPKVSPKKLSPKKETPSKKTLTQGARASPPRPVNDESDDVEDEVVEDESDESEDSLRGEESIRTVDPHTHAFSPKREVVEQKKGGVSAINVVAAIFLLLVAIALFNYSWMHGSEQATAEDV